MLNTFDSILMVGTYDGVALLEVSSSGEVDSIGSVVTPRIVTSITTNDNYAFVGQTYGSVLVLDMADATQPDSIGTYLASGTPNDLAVEDTILYVANDGSGLDLISIATPESPWLINQFSDWDFGFLPKVNRVVIDNGIVYALLSTPENGTRLVVIDARDAANLSALSDCVVDSVPSWTLESMSMELVGKLIIIAETSADLVFINVVDPRHPAVINTFQTPGSAKGTFYKDGTLFVADYSSLILYALTSDACACANRVGDVNGAGGDEPTIGDVAVMIDAKFISTSVACYTRNAEYSLIACLAEADINQSGGKTPSCEDISIGDIAILIDYLFISQDPNLLVDCL
jgi:hypothetical protein